MLARVSNTTAALLAMTLVTITTGGCRGLKRPDIPKWIQPLSPPQVSESFRRKPVSLPSERELCIQTARTVAEDGHVREAILLYEKAERISPDEPALDRPLAPLYARAGRTDQAVQRYRNVIRDDGPNAETWNNLAWTLMTAERYPEAVEAAQEGLRIDPDSPRLRSTLAVIHFHNGDSQSAFELFRDVHGESAAHHNLAVLEIERGNADAARHHLAQAVSHPDCSPQSEELQHNLARIAARQDDEPSLR